MTKLPTIATQRGERGGKHTAQHGKRRAPIHYTTEKRETVGAITPFGRLLREAIDREARHAAYRD